MNTPNNARQVLELLAELSETALDDLMLSYGYAVEDYNSVEEKQAAIKEGFMTGGIDGDQVIAAWDGDYGT